ncbi:MAG: CoA transferase subunit A [Dermatophilaceae bacterium]
MAKIVDLREAAALVHDGMRLMIGGFMGCGNAHKVIDALLETGVGGLTLICNDAGLPGYGVGKLVEHHRVRTLVATHVGLNPQVAAQMNSGELQVQLVPQGSFVEKIRAGGAGLGGVLTPTGIGTIVAEGKQVIEVDGRQFLLEKPIRADVALINGFWIDTRGNVWYKGTTRNFNYVMAMAADTVIAEADHLVQVGDIRPENVHTPGVLVDYIVDGARS